ncbi:glucosaminidase domain-containing protein [Patescibacteria group bacterium]|nr:glucosaminidase domain-containing protein [Patescibacteria group bacterium]
MTKKILLCFIFFAVSPFVLGLTLLFSGNFSNGTVLGDSSSSSPQPNKIFAFSGEESGVIAQTIKSSDSTPIIIERYLKRYASPMLPHFETILSAAYRYDVSPQLIVAIAQQESNLGKKSPENCYNAWGWAIHERGTKCFENWDEAIETVARGIAENYCAKGFCDDPCVMMKKYTPKSNGSWCAGVNQFLREMRTGDF